MTSCFYNQCSSVQQIHVLLPLIYHEISHSPLDFCYLLNFSHQSILWLNRFEFLSYGDLISLTLWNRTVNNQVFSQFLAGVRRCPFYCELVAPMDINASKCYIFFHTTDIFNMAFASSFYSDQKPNLSFSNVVNIQSLQLFFLLLFLCPNQACKSFLVFQPSPSRSHISRLCRFRIWTDITETSTSITRSLLLPRLPL